MSEQKGNVIRQVLNLIEYGNISQTEAVQRLEAMIQSEIEKQDESADMELVTACEELLWQINTHGRIAFEDKHKESKAILMRRLARRGIVPQPSAWDCEQLQLQRQSLFWS